MNRNTHSDYFLLFALIASLVLVYFIAQPFLGPLLLAGIFAFLFQPIYQKSLRQLGNRESVAALTTTLVAVFIVLLPITFLGTQIFRESSQLYQSLITVDNTSIIGSFENNVRGITASLPLPEEFTIDFNDLAKRGLQLFIQHTGSLFSSAARFFIALLVFVTSFYFFLKDGRRLKQYAVELSPLNDADDEFVISRLKTAIKSAITGSLSIGLIQGALSGVGYAIFGVPNPVLWGSVTAIAALLPGIGTGLIIFPAVAFLFIVDNTSGGVGLLIWGVLAVGLIDNFLGPRLVGRGMQLHPLAVFISVLGGIAFFGPLGFLLGPLTMSLSLALIEIYTTFNSDEQ